MPTTVEQLRFAIEAFESELHDDVFSPSRLVNPLLNIWQLASDVDPNAAAVLEQLLAVVTQRNLIAKDELHDVLSRVLATAAGEVEGASSRS